MNDFIIRLQAMIDQSSLTNLQKKLLKQKLNIPVTVDTTASEQSIHNLANSILAFQQNNTKMSRSTKKELDTMYNSLINGANLSKKEVTELKTRFTQLKVQVRDAGQLGKSFGDSIKQGMGSFATWLPASQIIMKMVQSVTSAVSELKELDNILTEISKTSDLTSRQLENLGNNAFEAASKYGKTASDYLTGVQEMYRAGFDNAEEMAELSILAQSAGDMDATSSNDYLMATNAAYNYKGSVEELNKVLDSQNYITNNAAVSMKDMADATSESASVAAQYGVQINELSAMIATVASKTRESGAEVGTALRSIFVTLQDTTSKPVIEAFDSVGIAMTKFENGVEKLKTPIELLRELSVAFNELPEGAIERSQILTDIGKKYHANTLAAVLDDWTVYEDMLELYSQGMGSAAKEAEKSSNNWSGSWNKVKNSWTDLIQNFADSDAIIGAINVLNKLIIAIDKLSEALGGLPTLAGIGAGLFSGFKDVGRDKMFSLIVLNCRHQ